MIEHEHSSENDLQSEEVEKPVNYYESASPEQDNVVTTESEMEQAPILSEEVKQAINDYVPLILPQVRKAGEYYTVPGEPDPLLVDPDKRQAAVKSIQELFMLEHGVGVDSSYSETQKQLVEAAVDEALNALLESEQIELEQLQTQTETTGLDKDVENDKTMSADQELIQRAVIVARQIRDNESRLADWIENHRRSHSFHFHYETIEQLEEILENVTIEVALCSREDRPAFIAERFRQLTYYQEYRIIRQRLQKWQTAMLNFPGDDLLLPAESPGLRSQEGELLRGTEKPAVVNPEEPSNP